MREEHAGTGLSESDNLSYVQLIAITVLLTSKHIGSAGPQD